MADNKENVPEKKANYKGTTRHCCFGTCTSDSRYPDRPDMNGVSWIPFPKPVRNREKCQRWVQACGRENFTIEKVKKWTYICCKHFVGGNGPTQQHPDPIPATYTPSQIERFSKKRKAPTPRAEPVSKRALFEASEALLLLQSSVEESSTLSADITNSEEKPSSIEGKDDQDDQDMLQLTRQAPLTSVGCQTQFQSQPQHNQILYGGGKKTDKIITMESSIEEEDSCTGFTPQSPDDFFSTSKNVEEIEIRNGPPLPLGKAKDYKKQANPPGPNVEPDETNPPKIVLFDFENMTSFLEKLLNDPRAKGDKIELFIVFASKNKEQLKRKVEEQHLCSQMNIQFVEVKNTENKNSVDMVIVALLGYLHSHTLLSVKFRVISGDNSFKALEYKCECLGREMRVISPHSRRNCSVNMILDSIYNAECTSIERSTIEKSQIWKKKINEAMKSSTENIIFHYKTPTEESHAKDNIEFEFRFGETEMSLDDPEEKGLLKRKKDLPEFGLYLTLALLNPILSPMVEFVINTAEKDLPSFLKSACSMRAFSIFSVFDMKELQNNSYLERKWIQENDGTSNEISSIEEFIEISSNEEFIEEEAFIPPSNDTAWKFPKNYSLNASNRLSSQQGDHRRRRRRRGGDGGQCHYTTPKFKSVPKSQSNELRYDGSRSDKANLRKAVEPYKEKTTEQ